VRRNSKQGGKPGPSIASHVPCKSDARREIQPSIVDRCAVGGETGIAGIVESRGSCREYGAPDALRKPIKTKPVYGAKLQVKRIEWFPPQPIVQSQSRCGF